ncbi:MAG: hypothetical protein HY747_00410 [Elusimicrobia bacterium]|nr:hypothetical protein [Elusimicrobiota bacterium]
MDNKYSYFLYLVLASAGISLANISPACSLSQSNESLRLDEATARAITANLLTKQDQKSLDSAGDNDATLRMLAKKAASVFVGSDDPIFP